MHVFTFMESDPCQQAADLRQYYNEKGAEISPELSQKGVEDDMHKIIGVCDSTFSIADVSETEVESSLNSIVSVLMLMPQTEKTESMIVALCEKLSKAPQIRNLGNVALKVLYVLFLALPRDIAIRFHIYYTMVQVSGQIGQIESVYHNLDTLKEEMKKKKEAQQAPTTEQWQQLLRMLHQTLLANGMGEDASTVMLELLGTYTTENASQARDDAHRCIIASLADPNTYVMDHLLSLKPVRFLEGELIHDLLTIFVSDKLPVYINFYNNHKEFISSIGLDHESNLRKMRLVTFLQLAEETPEMTFSYMQAELQLEDGQVEPFIIQALKTKLLVARMDQSQKKCNVTTVVHRTFGRAQWEALRDTLTTWKTNLALVKENMHAIASAPMTQAQGN